MPTLRKESKTIHISGLHRDNGKDNGSYHLNHYMGITGYILRLYRDSPHSRVALAALA